MQMDVSVHNPYGRVYVSVVYYVSSVCLCHDVKLGML